LQVAASTSRATVEPAHIPALDGLRGVAILLVLMFHVGTELTDRFERVFGWGFMGVDLFFVLSGFLITRILLATKNAPRYFRNFYARRALRILPLYYGVLLGLTVLWPLVRGPSAGLGTDALWLWLHLTNLRVAVLGHWLPVPWPLNFNHFWSLAVEEQFYLIWPAAVLLLSPRRLLGACALVIASSFVFRWYTAESPPDYTFAYVHTLARIDVLCWGALLAIAADLRGGVRAWSGVARWLGAVSGLVLLVLAGTRGLTYRDPWVLRVALAVTGPFFASFVCLVIEGHAKRYAEWRPLRWLGRYSYGLYVFHALFMPGMSRLVTTLTHRSAMDGGVGSVAFVFLAVSIPLGCAVASYELYEKRFLRLKRLFAARSAQPLVAGTSTAELRIPSG
jgi:peptidoglycan/LPS O-acetylase OafA/YrhL